MILAEISARTTEVVTQNGFGLGSMLAVTFCWTRNRSILWAIIAGILSWLYVIYFAFSRRNSEAPR